jgi:hypothetical protein
LAAFKIIQVVLAAACQYFTSFGSCLAAFKIVLAAAWQHLK